MSTPVDHPRLGTFGVVNQAIKMSRTPSSIRVPTPELGEHTDLILSELGYDESSIIRFHEEGVV